MAVINPCDPIYAGGADPTGVADSLAAFQAAIVAWYDTGRDMGRCLYIPSGDYRITDTLVFPGVVGGTVVGDGRFTSRIIWDGPGGNDILVFNSSQHLTIQNFSIWGLAGEQKPRYAINFDYNPVVNAATGNTLRDILIDGLANTDVVGTGVYLSNAYGNNSEMNFFGVFINKFSNMAVHAPGTQQKALNFFGCGFNGGWDGEDPDANGGEVGLACAGSFQWFGGGVGAVRTAAFLLLSPNDPSQIIGCQSERAYCFLSGGLIQNANSSNILIQNCRVDTDCVPDPDGVIQYAGWGSLSIRGNAFFNGLGEQTYIQVSSNGFLDAIEVVYNSFGTLNSVNYNPLIINSSGVYQRPTIRMYGNTFADATGNRAPRNEILDDVNTGLNHENNLRGLSLWSFDWTVFTANANSQTIVLRNVPQSFTFKDFRGVVYNYFIRSGGGTIKMKIGTTSGGDELLQEVVISYDGVNVTGDNSTSYGEQPGERGTRMQASSHEPNHFGSATVYVTVTTDTGTLGNGSITNLTRGQIHLPVEYMIHSRLLI